jgi:hypothetical protein
MLLPQTHPMILHLHLHHCPRLCRRPLKKAFIPKGMNNQRDLWHSSRGFLASSPDVDEEVEEWPNTSLDKEVAHKLFSKLNRDPLGPPGDSTIIVISNSEEEEDEPAPTAIV